MLLWLFPYIISASFIRMKLKFYRIWSKRKSNQSWILSFDHSCYILHQVSTSQRHVLLSSAPYQGLSDCTFRRANDHYLGNFILMWHYFYQSSYSRDGFKPCCPTGALVSHHNTTLLQRVSISALPELYSWWPEIHTKELFPPRGNEVHGRQLEKNPNSNVISCLVEETGVPKDQHEIVTTETLIHLNWWVWVPWEQVDKTAGKKSLQEMQNPEKEKEKTGRRGWERSIGSALPVPKSSQTSSSAWSDFSYAQEIKIFSTSLGDSCLAETHPTFLL